jgi:hypothetical protein
MHFVARVHTESAIPKPLNRGLWLAKTLADFEANNIAAALPPLFCYNSYPCCDLSACSSERWFVSCARVEVSYWRIPHYVNNSPY